MSRFYFCYVFCLFVCLFLFCFFFANFGPTFAQVPYRLVLSIYVFFTKGETVIELLVDVCRCRCRLFGSAF